jgi:hypothetical protein
VREWKGVAVLYLGISAPSLYTYTLYISALGLDGGHVYCMLMHSRPSRHTRIIRKHPAAAGRPALAGFIPAQGRTFHDAGTNVK